MMRSVVRASLCASGWVCAVGCVADSTWGVAHEDKRSSGIKIDAFFMTTVNVSEAVSASAASTGMFGEVELARKTKTDNY